MSTQVLVVAFVVYILIDLRRRAREKSRNKIQPLGTLESTATVGGPTSKVAPATDLSRPISKSNATTQGVTMPAIVSTGRVSRVIATDVKLREILRGLENAAISRNPQDVREALANADTGLASLRTVLTSKAASTKRNVGRIRALVLKCKWLARAADTTAAIERLCDSANEIGASKALEANPQVLEELRSLLDRATESLKTDSDRRLQQAVERGEAWKKRLQVARGASTLGRVRKAVRSKIIGVLRLANAANPSKSTPRATPEQLRERLTMLQTSDDVLLLAELLFECEEHRQRSGLPLSPGGRSGGLALDISLLVNEMRARLMKLLSRPSFHVSFAGGVPGIKDESASALEDALNRRNADALRTWAISYDPTLTNKRHALQPEETDSAPMYVLA